MYSRGKDLAGLAGQTVQPGATQASKTATAGHENNDLQQTQLLLLPGGCGKPRAFTMLNTSTWADNACKRVWYVCRRR